MEWRSFVELCATDYESPHGKVSVIFNIRQVICRNIAFLTRLGAIFRLSSANRGQKSTTFRKNKGTFFQKQRTFFGKSRSVLNRASRRNPVAAQRRQQAPHLRAFRRGAAHSRIRHARSPQPPCRAKRSRWVTALRPHTARLNFTPNSKKLPQRTHKLKIIDYICETKSQHRCRLSARVR